MIFAKPLVVTLIFFIVFLTLNSDVDSKKTSTSSDSTSSSGGGGGSHQQKSVKLTLTSKWRQTPFLLEIAEFLAEENPDLFWSFIDLIEEKFGQNVNVGSFTTKEQYDVGLRIADQLLRSKSKLAILKFSLSLRSYSPTVAMFQQITDDIMASSLSDNNTSSSDYLQNCDSFVELSFDEKLLETEKFKRFSCSRDEIRESLETLVAYLKETSANLQPQLRNPLLYSIDHQFPVAGSQTKLGTIILYGNIGTSSFFELHRTLKKIVSNAGNQLRYAVRHYYTKSHLPITSGEKVGLSGYGVELAIKSTEYKQQDDTRVRGEADVTSNSDSDQKPDHVSGFVFSKLRELFPDQHEKLSEFQNYLIDTDKEIATLKVWELQEISLQAATKVMSVNKDEALKALKDIAQNFPSVARSLAKISVDQDLKREILKNQHYFMHNLNLGTTDSALFINGLYYDVDSVDVFSLFDLIKQEQDVVDKLYRLLNGDSEKIRKFIKLDVSFEKQDYQIDIRDGSVNYVNNIEEDRNYRNWPVGLHEMLRPSYPGMMRSVRRNIFHLVLVVDPSKKSSHDIIQMAESFYLYKAPVRIGLVFAVNQNSSVTGLEDAGVACLEAFNYISQEKTPYEALSFLTDLIAKAAQHQQSSTSTNSGSDPGNLKPEYVLEHFKTKIGKSNLEDIFGADSEFDTGRQLAWDFVTRTGIGEAPKALLNGVLLKDSYLNLNYFEDVVLSEVMKQTTPLQKAIYKGEISDDEESVLDWLMNKETVMPRLNRIILGIDQQQSVTQSIVDFSGTAQKTSSTSGFGSFKQMNVKDLQATVVNSLRYINTKTDSPNPVTVWLVSDFRSIKNRHIFLAALDHLRQSSSTMRLAPIYKSFSVFNRITESAFQSFQTATPKQLILFMQKFLRYSIENPDMDSESNDETVKKIFDFIPEEFRSTFNEKYEKLLPTSEPFQLYPEFSNRILNLSPDDFAVILNGKVYRVPDSEPFIEADFSLMEKFINNLITDKVMPLLTDKELLFGGGGTSSGVSRKGSDLILKISAALLGKSQSKTRYDVTNIREDHSVLLLEPRDADQPFVELSAVLDPLSRGTQKISPILETLYQVFNARIKIYFNCVDKHSDMPLKSYYRFVLDEEPQFDLGTGELLQPTALFSSMPKTPLFTLGMAVPENWLVEAVESVHDLDNIHLERIEGSTVSAIFELEHLLVEGHCFEQSSGTPPRGLQFTLGTESNPVMFDTIVMANLGYFQLKANPGIWMLKLRQGRSDDIYTIVSHEGGTDQLVANASEVIPIVSNFRSLVIKIRVNKKPGKQNEELLYDSEEGGSADSNGGGDNSLWSSFSWGSEDANSNKKKSSDGSNVTSNDDEDSKRINIFSLASGHLYERLLRIMMTSVLKHTKTPVKFWFLKNYLSPHFKNVLPFMAEKYGFDYELVEYKWPRWLHQQTEKQRIIWGYKILFLDVLFPLDVKKIIFVDADQVVRADLKELRDLDLEGAPYGYTPFCDSRKEMDGFRFWKSGYWQTHLHGRKYHISALYVVDLQKFRRIAAGDRLRGQYQGLSQDPNSLSNLDQDLPNNMIHQVAIKSLPQEWLWCETWCSDDSKKKAKTIDLCNNPKTKEPKLTGARRIVSEWEDYDRELKKMMDQYNNSQQETKDNKKDSNQKPEVTEKNSHSKDSKVDSHQEL